LYSPANIEHIVTSKPRRFVCVDWKERKGRGMEGRIQTVCLAGIRTVARASESNALLLLRNMGQRPERTL